MGVFCSLKYGRGKQEPLIIQGGRSRARNGQKSGLRASKPQSRGENNVFQVTPSPSGRVFLFLANVKPPAAPDDAAGREPTRDDR